MFSSCDWLFTESEKYVETVDYIWWRGYKEDAEA